MHGKKKAWGNFPLNAKRVLTRVQENPSQQLLLEMMYVCLQYLVLNIRFGTNHFSEKGLLLYVSFFLWDLRSESAMVNTYSVSIE